MHMKTTPLRFALLAATCLAFSLTARAQLKWDTDLVKMNASPEDVDAQLRYPFVNAGKTPINFLAIMPACGCTTARLAKTAYAPGERGEITAIFNVAGRSGVQEKTILVKTNDPAEPEKTLKFRVHILQTVQIDPKIVVWDADAKPKTQSIKLKVVRDEPLNLVRLEVSPPDWKARLNTIKQGREYTVDLTPINPAQPSAGLLTVSADTPADHPQTFRARLRIK